LDGTAQLPSAVPGRPQEIPRTVRYHVPVGTQSQASDRSIPKSPHGSSLHLFAHMSDFFSYAENDPVTRIDPSGLLFGGLINAGECYGQAAAQYWAERQVATGNPLYAIPGLFASLWTPGTSDYTFATLSFAYALSYLPSVLPNLPE